MMIGGLLKSRCHINHFLWCLIALRNGVLEVNLTWHREETFGDCQDFGKSIISSCVGRSIYRYQSLFGKSSAPQVSSSHLAAHGMAHQRTN